MTRVFQKLNLIFILGFLIFLIVRQLPNLGPAYDPDYWANIYENSQWVKGEAATTALGDAGLYAFAGYRQIKGDDPSLINPEHPPLGKYLFGISFLLSKRLWPASFLAGLGIIYLSFLVSLRLSLARWLAFLPGTLLLVNPLFSEALFTTELDLLLTFFISLSIFLFAVSFPLKNSSQKKLFLLGILSLVAVSTTKMHLLGFGLTGLLAIFYFAALLFSNRRSIPFFLLSWFVFPFAYAGVYGVFFLKGHTLSDFKYLHFWIRHFARVRVPNYPSFQIFKIFLFGRWQTWWGDFQNTRVYQYSFLWPISFLFALKEGLLALRKKNFLPLCLFLIGLGLLAIYSFGVPYPRYLLPVLFCFYPLFIKSFVSLFLKRKHE